MSGVDVAALREKLAKATPGPWLAERNALDEATIGSLSAPELHGEGCLAVFGFDGDEDAEAVCALVNAAPALLDEIEALHAESKQADDLIFSLNEDIVNLGKRLARQDAAIVAARKCAANYDCCDELTMRGTVPNVYMGELLSALLPLDVLDTPAETP